MSSPEQPGARQFKLRQGKLTKRAVEKYGPDAALPGGVPGYDVTDYMLNELAGLERYADMVEIRLSAVGQARPHLVLVLKRRLRWLREMAMEYGSILEHIRAEALAAGIRLGAEEEI